MGGAPSVPSPPDTATIAVNEDTLLSKDHADRFADRLARDHGPNRNRNRGNSPYRQPQQQTRSAGDRTEASIAGITDREFSIEAVSLPPLRSFEDLDAERKVSHRISRSHSDEEMDALPRATGESAGSVTSVDAPTTLSSTTTTIAPPHASTATSPSGELSSTNVAADVSGRDTPKTVISMATGAQPSVSGLSAISPYQDDKRAPSLPSPPVEVSIAPPFPQSVAGIGLPRPVTPRYLQRAAHLVNDDHDHLEAVHNAARTLADEISSIGRSGFAPPCTEWDEAQESIRFLNHHMNVLSRRWSRQPQEPQRTTLEASSAISRESSLSGVRTPQQVIERNLTRMRSSSSITTARDRRELAPLSASSSALTLREEAWERDSTGVSNQSSSHGTTRAGFDGHGARPLLASSSTPSLSISSRHAVPSGHAPPLHAPYSSSLQSNTASGTQWHPRLGAAEEIGRRPTHNRSTSWGQHPAYGSGSESTHGNYANSTTDYGRSPHVPGERSKATPSPRTRNSQPYLSQSLHQRSPRSTNGYASMVARADGLALDRESLSHIDRPVGAVGPPSMPAGHRADAAVHGVPSSQHVGAYGFVSHDSEARQPFGLPFGGSLHSSSSHQGHLYHSPVEAGGHMMMMNAYETDDSSGSLRPSKYRKRSRAPAPGSCLSCGASDTPEWRRGPNGARTLCNACGLHYSKLIRRKGTDGSNDPDAVSIEELRASLKLPM